MFRTDVGDNEDNENVGPLEWKHKSLEVGHRDPVGDDDVDVLLTGRGGVAVEYRREHD